MTRKIAIIVDDLAADRQIAAHALQRVDWTVHTARNSIEAIALIERVVNDETASHTFILTDLHMPNDPTAADTPNQTTTGARFALYIRTQMEQGAVPRMPIVALTALTEREMHMTALAFGCDAVLTKPATPDLALRIEQALAQDGEESDAVGAYALLQLLRCRLAELTQLAPPAIITPNEQHITRALLAYHRQGLVGLGQSVLASWVVPHCDSVIQRGEETYKQLLTYLDEIMRLGVHESMNILYGELKHNTAPADQCHELGISRSEYYRRRREAVAVLLELVTRQ